MFKDERQIQEWLVTLIDSGDLLSEITNVEAPQEVLNNIGDPNRIPNFTVDYLTRRRIAEVSRIVLDGMEYLERVSADKSISAVTGEILRPDVVAYNMERNAIVVFEIKKDSKTARETITELMAYEQELQNYFPFTSNLDIHFVVLSREWPVALEHAIAGLVTWSRKSILCLKLVESADADPHMELQLPQAWRPLASVGLPESALSVASLCLYPKRSEDKGAERDPPLQLFTALKAIARKGDREKSHGFGFLWRDTSNVSMCRWMFTIGVIDPYRFFLEAESRDLDIRDNDLRSFFLEKAGDLAMGNHPSSLFAIADDAQRYLSRWWDPIYEGLVSWETERSNLKVRAFPITFEFWGALAQYAEEFLLHPAVMQSYMPEVTEIGLGWDHPMVAIPILDDLLGERPIKDGLLTARNCFHIGKEFGIWLLLKQNEGGNDTTRQEAIECCLEWQIIRMSAVLNEIRVIYQSCKDMKTPPPAVSLRESSSNENDSSSRMAMVEWIRDELIGKSDIVHQVFFDAGFQVGILTDEALGRLVEKDARKQMLESSSTVLDIALQITVEIASDDEVKARREEEIDVLAHSLTEAIFGSTDISIGHLVEWRRRATTEDYDLVVSALESIILPLVDLVTPPVWHEIEDIARANVDWGYFRQGVMKMHERGEKYPCVVLGPDGSIGTTTCPEKYMALMKPITNPMVEVYFWNRMHGLDTVILMTWEALKAKFSEESQSD